MAFLANELNQRGIENTTPSDRERALRALDKGGKGVALGRPSLANAIAADLRGAAERDKRSFPPLHEDVYAEIDALREFANSAANWLAGYKRERGNRRSKNAAFNTLVVELEQIWILEVATCVRRRVSNKGETPNDDPSEQVGEFFIFVQCVLLSLAIRLPATIAQLLPDLEQGLKGITREAIAISWRRNSPHLETQREIQREMQRSLPKNSLI